MMSQDSSKKLIKLFIDSSHYLQFGLLDEDNSWIEFQCIENLKASSIIHKNLHDMLEKNNLKARDISNLIIAAGPGSYTGIRLGEGLGQMFAWQGANISSFYHFEIPFWIGFEKGSWVSNAYKKEFFIHTWDGENYKQSLVSEDELKKMESGQMFSFERDLKGLSFKSTNELIKTEPQKIFDRVLERNKRFDPFYYRELDQEFNKAKS